jgi:hypothetical protein
MATSTYVHAYPDKGNLRVVISLDKTHGDRMQNAKACLWTGQASHSGMDFLMESTLPILVIKRSGSTFMGMAVNVRCITERATNCPPVWSFELITDTPPPVVDPCPDVPDKTPYRFRKLFMAKYGITKVKGSINEGIFLCAKKK